MILLCKAHHHLIHHTGFTITADNGRFVFRDPAGTVLQPAPTRAAVTEPLPDVDHETVPQWAGHELDLDYVLSTLMQRRDLRRQQREHLHEQLLAA